VTERTYVVFDCEACRERIFADRAQLGQRGVCPVCGKDTAIGKVTPSGSKIRTASAPRTQALRTPSGETKTATTSSGKVAGGKSSGTRPALGARGKERRRSRRVVLNAELGIESKTNVGRPETTDLQAVDDLSESGVGFSVRGEKDTKKLTGYGPPPWKVGDGIGITLHIPELFRPRTVKAIVRRVDAHATKKGIFHVGVEFVGLSAEARHDLKKIVDRRSSDSRDT
jgi:hypothetical protein